MATKNTTHVCPYNDELDCDTTTCEHCGWYPPVAEKRRKEIMKLKLYKVPFTGYCEVWAKSHEEASEKAETVEHQFLAHYDFGDPICLEKEEKNEVDRQSP
jgi:hypothetical protein